MPTLLSSPPTDQSDWLTDANGNRCSIAYFGSREAAQAALDSLRDCRDCTNCSRCSDCSRCSGCSNIANLYGKRDLKGDPDSKWSGPPPIPRIENIHEKVLEAASQPGALDMSTWHRCGTTHCRAGWAVHLAGEAGYALEHFHGAALAAQLIYRESNPALPVSPVRFYETDEQALADMRAMAARERGEIA